MTSADTAPDALSVQRAVWRRLGPEGRVSEAVAMSEAMKRIAMDGIAARHPDLDEQGVGRRYVREMHGVDLGTEM